MEPYLCNLSTLFVCFSELTSGLAVASKEKAKREKAQRDSEIYASVAPNVYSRPNSTMASLQQL